METIAFLSFQRIWEIKGKGKEMLKNERKETKNRTISWKDGSQILYSWAEAQNQGQV